MSSHESGRLKRKQHYTFGLGNLIIQRSPAASSHTCFVSFSIFLIVNIITMKANKLTKELHRQMRILLKAKLKFDKECEGPGHVWWDLSHIDLKVKNEYYKCHKLAWTRIPNLLRRMYVEKMNMELVFDDFRTWRASLLKGSEEVYEKLSSFLEENPNKLINKKRKRRLDAYIELNRKEFGDPGPDYDNVFKGYMMTLPKFVRKFYKENLKTKKYRKMDERQHDVCAICIAEKKASQQIVQLSCCHEFHFRCAFKWIINKALCPLCRALIYVELPDE